MAVAAAPQPGSAADLPLRIASPLDGESVASGVGIPVQTVLGSGYLADEIQVVKFLLDGEGVPGSRDWSYPFSRDLPASGLTTGTHTVTIDGLTVWREPFTHTIAITVGEGGGSGGEGSSAGGTDGTDDTSGSGVSIDSPGDGQMIALGQDITITTRLDGGLAPEDVNKVEFLMDGARISGGQDWSYPFSRRILAGEITAGDHSISIKAKTPNGYLHDSVAISVGDIIDGGEDTGGNDTGSDGSSGGGTVAGGDTGWFAGGGGCVADTTFGTGGDFDPARGDTLTKAFFNVPLGGTLGILEGDYTLAKDGAAIWRKMKRTSVTICGVGRRPAIRVAGGETASWAVAEYSRLTVANLELQGIEITNAGYLTGDLHFESIYLHDTRNECITTSPVPQLGTPIEGNQQGDPTEFHSITFKNVDLVACSGRAGGDHAAYIATRGCVLRADGLHVEHPSGLEGFRSLCRINVITNSYFSNVVGDPAAATALTPQGVSPLQVIGCSATILRDSRIEIVGDSGKTGFWIAARRSITGCDMPNWTPESDGLKFWDPSFWAGVNSRPITDPLNPEIFPLFVSDNTFVFHDVGAAGGGNIAIKDAGTYPTRRSAPYSTTSIYKDVPDDDPATYRNEGWSERHVVFTANNVFLGWDTDFLGDGFGAPPDPASDPDALVPPLKPARLRVHVGGDDADPDIALPSWWPRVCTDFDQYSWYDEGTPNHEGRPTCN